MPTKQLSATIYRIFLKLHHQIPLLEQCIPSAEMVAPSLGVMAAERHAFQVKTVEMVGQALECIERRMKAAVAEAHVYIKK